MLKNGFSLKEKEEVYYGYLKKETLIAVCVVVGEGERQGFENKDGLCP